MSTSRDYRSLRDPQTLERFVRNLREGIYITNHTGEILDANPAFLGMLGVKSVVDLEDYPASQLLVDPERRAEELSILSRHGAVREFELEIRRPDGGVLTVLDTAYVVEDPLSGEKLFHGMLVDITRRKELEHKLREQSLRDPLTGLYNRRQIAAVERELRSRGSSWGAIVIDIDGFKAYNDEFGHAAGDRALVQVSRFLNRIIRTDDTAIRLGGDEFLLIIEVVGKAPATEIVVDRLKSQAGRACPVPFSLGAATRRASESLEQTINRADQNLVEVRIDARGPNRRRRKITRRLMVATPD